MTEDKEVTPQKPSPTSSPRSDDSPTRLALSVQFQGPLPPPDILAQYNDVIPNAAERILQMAEQRHHHMMGLDISEIRRAYAGLIIGFVVAMAFLLASYSLIMSGHDLAGGVLGTVDITALVAVFVIGRYTGQSKSDMK